MLLNSSWERQLRIRERNNLAATEASAGMGGDASGDRAEIPQDCGDSCCAPAAHGSSWWIHLQPLEKTKSEQLHV